MRGGAVLADAYDCNVLIDKILISIAKGTGLSCAPRGIVAGVKVQSDLAAFKFAQRVFDAIGILKFKIRCRSTVSSMAVSSFLFDLHSSQGLGFAFKKFTLP